jgi:serine/threonine-protein kinase
MATIAADRELLFGLLALQNGLINQAQLLAAFQAWTLERSKGLADHLVALGHLSPARRPVVEAMAALHLEAYGGDVVRSLTAVPASPATRAGLASIKEPEIEATLARVGRAQAANGKATDVDNRDDPDRTAGLSLGAATSDGQRFRLLRPHARGGLGEVFVALDAELHREVALKQILEKHADDAASRQRFVAEAEITGGLEHPGIVPVYGLGTYGGGRPYYAMRFIKGDSLKEAIERFHADPALKGDPSRRSFELRKLLRRFLDVCNAIDYAHSRGVIHRDLKPANIILGRHGETLVVDWGLAKAIGRADPSVGEQTIAPSSGGSSETLPGSALGTPAYMSPEQAFGDLDQLGPRSDVYSLGATLYCLLTGKPPIEGEDVGAVLRQVQRGEFVPPRQRQPSLDAALDAVCTKAMAHHAEERYPSCRALAEDVERWMADEPVSARREPLAARVLRWVRHHRTGATTAAVAALVALVGLSAVLGVQARANRDLMRANGRERQANQDLAAANAHMQARFDLALEAIKRFHTGVSEDMLLKNDTLKSVRDRLLSDTAEFYKRLGDQLRGQPDRRSRWALGHAYYEMAELAAKIGATSESIAGHEEALAVWRGLAKEPGTEGEATAEVSHSLTALGSVLEVTGLTEQAEAAYGEAIALLEGLIHARPGLAVYRSDLGFARHHLGWLLSQTGRSDQALAELWRSVADLKAVVGSDPSAEAGRRLARAYSDMSRLLYADKPSEALTASEQSLAILTKLAEANPAVTEIQVDLARSHSNISRILRLGRKTDARAALERSLVILTKLAEANPAVTEIQVELARSHQYIGWDSWLDGRATDALAAFEWALVIRENLAAANPTVPGFRRAVGQSLTNLGRMRLATGQLPGAITALRRSLEIHEGLVRDHPTVTDYQSGLAYILSELGRARLHNGRPAEAVDSLQRANGLWYRLPTLRPEDRTFLVRNHALLAALATKPGSGLSATESRDEAERAMAALRQVVSTGHGHGDLAILRSDPDLEPLRARPDFQAVMLDLAFPADPFIHPH